MNKYTLDIITGGNNSRGMERYIINADGFDINYESYCFYIRERKEDGRSERKWISIFPVGRTIISSIIEV